VIVWNNKITFVTKIESILDLKQQGI